MINRIEDFLPRPFESSGKSGKRSEIEARRLDVQELLGQVGEFVCRNPKTCLIAAFGLGVACAWLVKRK